MSIDRSEDNFIVTATGRRFYFMTHTPQDICLDDIAIALSRLCRFTGHCKRFYSVLEHSLLVAKKVHGPEGLPPEEVRKYKLAGLLHDAAEAYVGDLNGPLKHFSFMKEYCELEARIQHSIAVRFGVEIAFDNEFIFEADRRMRHTEKRDLMPVCLDCPDLKWTDEDKYPPYDDEDLRQQMASAFAQRFVQVAEWYGAKI